MKRIVLMAFCIVIMMISYSQSENSQGAIIYEEVLKIDIQMDNMTPEMQAMMPTENRNKTILFFDENASRYENYESTEDKFIDEESEGGSVQIMISQPDNILFRDIENKKIIEQTEFMTRVFLIESDYSNDQWKFTGNKKMILDFPCQEAVKKVGESEVTVWFTPVIPVSSGPGKYAGLPGLVLAMEADNGDRTIIAKSVELKQVDKSKIKKPNKGKKVTMSEYTAIVEEKTKEMGGDGTATGSQTVIMRITQ